MNNQILSCPICGKKLKSLHNHLLFKHHMTYNQIKEQFPDIQMQKSVTLKKLPCPHCNRVFSMNAHRQLHIKMTHPQFYIKPSRNDTSNCKYTCGVCQFKTNMIYNHVATKHCDNISWSEYCDKYQHNPDDRSSFTDKHKKCLSVNKQAYYDSDRGTIEKENLRRKFTGPTNPACRPEIRSKISDAAVKRMIENNNNMFEFTKHSYGIQFKFEYNNHIYHTRSFEEFKVFYVLLTNSVQFEYETKILNYIMDGKPKKYILDLFIQNEYIEIKQKCGLKVQYDPWYDLPIYKTINAMLEAKGERLQILDFTDICNKYSLKIPFTNEIYLFARNLLNANKCKISYYPQKKLFKRSRIIENIDPDYKNNPNINFKI